MPHATRQASETLACVWQMTTLEYTCHTQTGGDAGYRLVALPPEVLAVVERGGGLTFRAGSDDAPVVVCTDSATYRVQQQNHTNTVMLMRREAGELVGYAQTTLVLELSRGTGQVDLAGVPVVEDLVGFRPSGRVSVQAVARRLPILPVEFEQEYVHRHLGLEIGGEAVLLGPALVLRLLSMVIAAVLAGKMDQAALGAAEVAAAIGQAEVTPEVVATVLARFGEPRGEESSRVYALEAARVSAWFGVDALRAACQRPQPLDDFLVRWKLALPPFYSAPLALEHLRGNYVQPIAGQVQYVDAGEIRKEQDAATRFKLLFALQPLWDLRDMEPFIADLNKKGALSESFVMKYARKRKSGGRVIVSKR